MRHSPRGLRRAVLLLLALTQALAEEKSRAYSGLWGSLFQQAADAVGGTGAPHSLRAALAALQARTLARLRERDDDARRSPLEGLFAAQLNVTLAMLEQASAPLVDRLEAMHTQLAQRGWPAAAAAADPQQLAALALVQGWALGALVGGGSGAAAGAALASSGSGGGHTSVLGASHGLAKQLADPSWTNFKPHTSLRLQNFGNAEGYSAALLTLGPCVSCPGAAVEASLRWGSRAAFILDCSHPAEAAADNDVGRSGSALGGMLQAAGKAAAASVSAALDRTVRCRLAVGGDGGGGAALESSHERPLLGTPRLDALRVRVCNLAPSLLQFPAALARGSAIRLAALKLNGRPLLPGELQVSAAAAADACATHLFRLNSWATHGEAFVLSGWVQLGGGESGGGVSGGEASSFGVGEMASVELSLGEYSQLGAAATRLLDGVTQQGPG